MGRRESHLSHNTEGGANTQAITFTAIFMAANNPIGKGN